MAARNKILIISDDRVFVGATGAALPAWDVTSTSPNGTPINDEYDVVIYHSTGSEQTIPASELTTSQRVLVVGADDTETMVAAVEAGAMGYATDDISMPDLISSIETIAAGGAVVPPLHLGSLLRHLIERRRDDAYLESAVAALTDRERDVFGVAASGAGRTEIAEQLFISPGTVRTHLQAVYRKLGVHSQAELVALAARMRGNGPPDDI